MKILLISALPPPTGGISIWTERYLSYCNNNSIEVELVNIALNGSRREKINNNTNIFDEIKRTKHILHDVKKKLYETKPDIVHINTSCGPFGIVRDYLCVRAAKRQKVSVVLHFHCNIENRIHNKIGLWILKKMASMADQVIVLNKKSQDFIAPYSIKAPVIMPNFIDNHFLSSSHMIREKIKEIVFTGHVQIEKGCREILNVAKLFPEIHFTLVGPVADEIAVMSFPNNVLMTGHINHEEIKNYLMDADLFLFPSYSEGFSLSLMEAMSTGLPSIVSDVGANREMIEDKGGIVVPSKDCGAIAQAIESLEDCQVRRDMSVWSINKVKNEYLTESVMSHMICLYRELEKV